MLPKIGTQFVHPNQLLELFVFFLQLYVANVLFHFGEVINWCPPFFIAMQSTALVNPVKDGSIAYIAGEWFIQRLQEMVRLM